MGVWQYLRNGARNETNPPAYQILLIFVERYLGDSETVLRLPSAIAGILAIPVLFALGRRMYSTRVGLTAALLLAVSWAPIYYSQEARTYSFTLLATLLTFLLWYPLFAAQKTRVGAPRRWATAYGIAAVVLLYLHYYGMLIVLGQALAALWLLRESSRDIRRVLVTYVLVLLAYAPWLLVSVWQYTHDAGTLWIQRPHLIFFQRYLWFAFNSNTAFAVVAALAMFAFAGLLIWRRRREGAKASFLREDVILLWWMGFPVLAAYLVSVIGRPLLVTHYLIVILPAVYLIVVRALVQLPARPWVKTMITLLAAFFILADLTLMPTVILAGLKLGMGYYTQPTKTQFREAVAHVVQNDSLGTPPLVIAFPWNAAYFDYYFARQDSRLRTDVIGGFKTDIAKVGEALRTSKAERVWFIRAQQSADAAFLSYLQEELHLIAHEKYVGADVWLFERR